MRPRIFLLSPGRLDGPRAQLLLSPRTTTGELASALRTREGAPIGDVYAFVSSLYFRGKRAYASKFARPPEGNPWLASGALVITPNRGLVPITTRVCLEHLEAFAETDIHANEPAFRKPLARDAAELARALGPEGEAVLLGSVASPKYVEPLLEALGDRLLFPASFVGRGDMSRGGLLLRSAAANEELAVVPVRDATRRGKRPPKLDPKTRAKPGAV